MAETEAKMSNPMPKDRAGALFDELEKFAWADPELAMAEIKAKFMIHAESQIQAAEDDTVRRIANEICEGCTENGAPTYNESKKDFQHEVKKEGFTSVSSCRAWQVWKMVWKRSGRL